MAKARPINGLDSQAPTGRNARLIVRERLLDMYEYAKYIEDPENIQQLHALRIATKRVRYTLEIFADFLPETSKNFAEELAALQEELGDLHDSEVMLDLLRFSLQDRHDSHENRPTSLGSEQPLLSANMLHAMLDAPGMSSAFNEQQRTGLAGFLQRQAQRRDQCYLAFRQHWDHLEQQQFRASLLEMLEQGKKG
jgi:inorganic triphosphatase YgiF